MWSVRHPLEIILSILETCRKPRIITTVMRKSNLAHDPMKKYLANLEKAGLIEIQKRSNPKCVGTDLFHTTKKGFMVLTKLDEVLEMLNNGLDS